MNVILLLAGAFTLAVVIILAKFFSNPDNYR